MSRLEAEATGMVFRTARQGASLVVSMGALYLGTFCGGTACADPGERKVVNVLQSAANMASVPSWKQQTPGSVIHLNELQWRAVTPSAVAESALTKGVQRIVGTAARSLLGVLTGGAFGSTAFADDWLPPEFRPAPEFRDLRYRPQGSYMVWCRNGACYKYEPSSPERPPSQVSASAKVVTEPVSQELIETYGPEPGIQQRKALWMQAKPSWTTLSDMYGLPLVPDIKPTDLDPIWEELRRSYMKERHVSPDDVSPSEVIHYYFELSYFNGQLASIPEVQQTLLEIQKAKEQH